jgi:hypothetical protein
MLDFPRFSFAVPHMTKPELSSAGMSASSWGGATEGPDTILVNGRVFTGSETHPYAEALAIKGTQILAIGTSDEISSKAGAKTRRIEFQEPDRLA